MNNAFYTDAEQGRAQLDHLPILVKKATYVINVKTVTIAAPKKITKSFLLKL